MEHPPTERRRLPMGSRLVSVLALAACTRGEGAAPPSGGDKPAAAVSNVASQVSTAAWGFDSVVTTPRPGSTCYASVRYVVVARDLENQVGSDLIVRHRGAPDAALPCDADSTEGDMVFRTGDAASRHPDAQYFLGLRGDLLVAGDGTGVISDLYVYDLSKRAKVLVVTQVRDDGDLEWVSPMTFAVWVEKAYERDAAAAGCPDTVPANPAELDSLMNLDLATLVLRPAGRSRCVVGQ